MFENIIFTVNISWEIDQYSADPQRTKVTTTVTCDSKFDFCVNRGNQLWTIHDLLIYLLQKIKLSDLSENLVTP